jgi:hypothetical protein
MFALKKNHLETKSSLRNSDSCFVTNNFAPLQLSECQSYPSSGNDNNPNGTGPQLYADRMPDSEQDGWGQISISEIIKMRCCDSIDDNVITTALVEHFSQRSYRTKFYYYPTDLLDYDGPIKINLKRISLKQYTDKREYSYIELMIILKRINNVLLMNDLPMMEFSVDYGYVQLVTVLAKFLLLPLSQII